MGDIQKLAAELGAEERTLRRAVAQGAIHCRRQGPRRTKLALGEADYLRGHWELLLDLRKALRTERKVRLAVLYGSVARGHEDTGSDLDVLVALVDDEPTVSTELAARLGRVSGRDADLARLDRIEISAPLLLDRVLDEGRVLVDRDSIWGDLRRARRAIRARAKRSYRRQMNEAAWAIEELTA
ncbi:MAG TPA: nucleotidyltransferase domain-containing protein [Solirubrobacterales bacterium]